ncbi:hypothetical protein NQZ68_003891 [Dissostichus eleginoides]|nr:hypothetical protein NQZ68_003891 [Dissostichus eleginoides]
MELRMEMLRPKASVFQQLTHSEPLHFKQQLTATSDMYLVPDSFGLAERHSSIKEKPERAKEVLPHLDELALSFTVMVRIRH